MTILRGKIGRECTMHVNGGNETQNVVVDKYKLCSTDYLLVMYNDATKLII
jgi:hypothetical protein